MRKPAKQATDKAGGHSPANPSEPILPDLTKGNRPEMVRIWKARGAALCEVCGYVKNDLGCVWNASH